jgi:hypothetical protein
MLGNVCLFCNWCKRCQKNRKLALLKPGSMYSTNVNVTSVYIAYYEIKLRRCNQMEWTYILCIQHVLLHAAYFIYCKHMPVYCLRNLLVHHVVITSCKNENVRVCVGVFSNGMFVKHVVWKFVNTNRYTALWLQTPTLSLFFS